MHVSAKNEKIRIKCEYIGGASKDNAFIDGTKLRGKIVEKNGYTEFSGIILTAPVFHFLMLLMCICKQQLSFTFVLRQI